jgi:YVTN family beta-propeller protein
VEFRILGPLEVGDGHNPVSLDAPKQRALLGVLLLHPNEVVSSERLIDELWGDRRPATAGKLVQTYISQLRRVLGAPLIETRPPGYLLRIEEDALDAARFRRLTTEARRLWTNGESERARALYAEALALWRGSPLADVSFESYAQNELDRLEEERLRVLIDRIDCDLALGGDSELVPELDALVKQHPLHERLRAQLMLSLYRSGRQGDALAAYQDARRVLAEELGLEPGEPLRRLERHILNHDPALQAPAASVAKARVVPNSLVQIDARTNEIVDVVPVGRSPQKVAAEGQSVWVVNGADETLTRVSMRDGRGDTVGGLRLKQPAGLTADGGRGLWVGSFEESELVRVDPTTLQIKERLQLPGETAPFVAAGAGSLWVTQPPPALDPSVPSAISRVSLLNSMIQNTFTCPAGVLPGQIAFGEGAAWVANVGDGTVWRIDAATEAIDRIQVGSQPTDVAVGFGSVWVPSLGRDAVWRIDPSTGEIEAIIPVGKEPLAVAPGGDAAWVTNQVDGTISRIDPRINRVVETIELGFNPRGVVVAGGAVWVAFAEGLI